MWADKIFLAHTFFGLQDGDLVITRIAFHPCPIFGSASGQNLRSNRIQPMHVPEKVHDVLGPSQQRYIPLNDNTVEAVIYKYEETLKKRCEGFHRSSPSDFLALTTRSSVRRPVESKRALPVQAENLSPGFQGRSPWLCLDTSALPAILHRNPIQASFTNAVACSVHPCRSLRRLLAAIL